MRRLMILAGALISSLAVAQSPTEKPDEIKTLTVARAEVLAERGGRLEINGVTKLSREVAEALSKHHGELCLNGLTTLSPDVAEALANHSGSLELNGLTTLSDKSAGALAQLAGELHLDGLQELVPEVANALAKHEGKLTLNGLNELSIACANALAKRKGRTYITRPNIIPAAALRALQANPQIKLAAGKANPQIKLAEVTPPKMQGLLDGRKDGQRALLMAKGGGSDETESAVVMALEWLKKQRNKKDGLWSLTGPYDDGGSQENQLAATAMALLAFQGAGNTPTEGPHKDVVARAWRSLLKQQQRDGSFDLGHMPMLHALYSHAQATMALCELYGMSRDQELAEKLAEPTARAVAYCVNAQGPDGGWRYEPGKPGDMSVTGWHMMALKTAEMAGIDVPPRTFQRLGGFLDSVAVEQGRRYLYMPLFQGKPGKISAAVTAGGLLSRQYLGWPQRDSRLVDGLDLLMKEDPIEFGSNKKDVYAWYYITQVAHHMEGEAWRRWNDRLREVLPREQQANGKQKGSWDPTLDRWGHEGGRLFVTCLCTYMLESYYRHLPLYADRAVERENW
jgi:hypothetical protein